MNFAFRHTLGAAAGLFAVLGLTSSYAQALPLNLLPNSDFSAGLGTWGTQYVGASAPGPTCCSGPFQVSGAGQVTGDFDGFANGGINFYEAITLSGNYTDAALSFSYYPFGDYSGQSRTLSVVIRDSTNTTVDATLFTTAVPDSDFNVAHAVSVTGLASVLDALDPGVYEFSFYEQTPETYRIDDLKQYLVYCRCFGTRARTCHGDAAWGRPFGSSRNPAQTPLTISAIHQGDAVASPSPSIMIAYAPDLRNRKAQPNQRSSFGTKFKNFATTTILPTVA